MINNLEPLKRMLENALSQLDDAEYGFVATYDGKEIVEVGNTSNLDYASVVEVTKRPESIDKYYRDNVEYERQDPMLIPRMYSQGRTNAVIARPFDGILVAIFYDMPLDISNKAGKERATWMWENRNKAWSIIKNTFKQNTA